MKYTELPVPHNFSESRGIVRRYIEEHPNQYLNLSSVMVEYPEADSNKISKAIFNEYVKGTIKRVGTGLYITPTITSLNKIVEQEMKSIKENEKNGSFPLVTIAEVPQNNENDTISTIAEPLVQAADESEHSIFELVKVLPDGVLLIEDESGCKYLAEKANIQTRQFVTINNYLVIDDEYIVFFEE